MKEQIFYINKYFITNQISDNLDFLPKTIKRRTDDFDKLTLECLNNCFDENIESIFCSSKKGEFSKLLKLIEQYKTTNEVSPTIFSGSVHNYSVGLFAMIKSLNITMTSLSSGDNSLSNGLLTALSSENKNILFSYIDIFPNHLGISLNISRIGTSAPVLMTINPNETEKDDINLFIKFLKGDVNSVKFELYTLKREI